MIEVSWTIFKPFLVANPIGFKYYDLNNNYYIFAFDGAFGIHTIIPKSSPANSDQTDFEDNFKANGNTTLQRNQILGGTDNTVIGNIGDKLKVITDLILDNETANLVISDELHTAIHEGNCYCHTEVHTLGNGETSYHLLITPNTTKRIHFRYTIQSTSSCTIALYENPTTTANGSPGAMNNKERNSTNTSVLSLYHGPTVTSNGTVLESSSLGSNGGSKQGSVEDTEEFVLKQNTKYLLKYTSSSSANDITEILIWYEV